MSAALEGYAMLKVSGRGAGLDALRQGMSARFTRKARVKAMSPGTRADVQELYLFDLEMRDVNPREISAPMMAIVVSFCASHSSP